MAVTRNEVAREAGVSPAVVSYVLNDGPRPVSVAARTRVLDAVARLGYRPDGLARSLRVGRTHTIGLVVPDATNPFFAELARAIEDAAYRRRYAVLVCNSADDLERERSYIENLAERRIDGLILVSAVEDQDVSGLTGLSIPVVALDRSPDEVPISTIRTQNEHAAYIGTSHLIEHGHREIGLIAGPGRGVSDDRAAGWRRALAEHGLSEGPIARGEFSFDGGHEAARRLLEIGIPFTAALAASDVQAVGAASAFRAGGLAVPNGVALVSIDGTEASAYMNPPLTTVAQAIGPMADAAVQHLIDKPTEVIHWTFDNELVVRESCGCTP
ncbi:LacI family DNA-binding transcriptional regulator [Agromyces tropicus]